MRWSNSKIRLCVCVWECVVCLMRVKLERTHQINTNRITEEEKKNAMCMGYWICITCVYRCTHEIKLFPRYLFFFSGFCWCWSFVLVFFFFSLFCDACCSGSAVCLKQRVRHNLWFALFFCCHASSTARERFIFSNFPKGRTRYHSLISLAFHAAPLRPSSRSHSHRTRRGSVQA